MNQYPQCCSVWPLTRTNLGIEPRLFPASACDQNDWWWRARSGVAGLGSILLWLPGQFLSPASTLGIIVINYLPRVMCFLICILKFVLPLGHFWLLWLGEATPKLEFVDILLDCSFFHRDSRSYPQASFNINLTQPNPEFIASRLFLWGRQCCGKQSWTQ